MERFLAHRLEELILLKWPDYSKQLHRFSAIPIKTPMAFFTEMEANNPKICVKLQKILDSQNNLREEQNWRYYPP